MALSPFEQAVLMVRGSNYHAAMLKARASYRNYTRKGNEPRAEYWDSVCQAIHDVRRTLRSKVFEN